MYDVNCPYCGVEFDYFELDDSGLIIKSPRGKAKTFNGRVRITDIAEIAEKYKEWRINE